MLVTPAPSPRHDLYQAGWAPPRAERLIRLNQISSGITEFSKRCMPEVS